jgi:hypothetical protein
MKINLFSIIPASVRYDRTLGDKSILLFGELMAAANAYGICEEDTRYFSTALNVDNRTIFRSMAQLEEQGHIKRLKENNKRKILVIQRALELPVGVELESDDLIPKADITDFVNQLISSWEKAVQTKVEKKELYTNMIAQRLGSFTKDDLMMALKNRATFVNQSPWHQEPANRQAALSIDTWLKSDETVLKWLNAKYKADEPVAVTPFKRN